MSEQYVLSYLYKSKKHPDLIEYCICGVYNSVEDARTELSNDEDYKGVTWPHDGFWDGKQEANLFEYGDYTEQYRITRVRD